MRNAAIVGDPEDEGRDPVLILQRWQGAMNRQHDFLQQIFLQCGVRLIGCGEPRQRRAKSGDDPLQIGHARVQSVKQPLFLQNLFSAPPVSQPPSTVTESAIPEFTGELLC